ncbi:MAG: CBS domain-containing protein [Myxococcota bacterium]
MIAKDIMTEEVLTVSASATVADAAEALQSMDIRHLPVVEGNSLVGILSDRDLKSVYMPKLVDGSTLQSIEERYHAPVTTLMTPDVVKSHPDATLPELIELILENRVGAVPITDPSTQALLGIVSYVDVLRAAGEALDE